jgi:hypothetical protein
MALMTSNILEDDISSSRIMAFWYWEGMGGEMGPHFMDVLKGSGEIEDIEEIGWGSGLSGHHYAP